MPQPSGDVDSITTYNSEDRLAFHHPGYGEPLPQHNLPEESITAGGERDTQRAERPWRKAWRRRSRARFSVRQRAGPTLTMVP